MPSGFGGEEGVPGGTYIGFGRISPAGKLGRKNPDEGSGLRMERAWFWHRSFALRDFNIT